MALARGKANLQVNCKFSARRLAALAFVSAAVPFGIAGHLLGDAAALDPGRLLAHVLAPRHLYLLALGLAALITLFLISRRARCAHGAAHAEELIRALPFGGQGARFAALSFAFQIAFFGATQAVEGCPIERGDLLAGLFTALAAALLGALLLALFQRRFVAFALLMAWTNSKQYDAKRERPHRPPFSRFAQRRGAFLFSIASRPPPVPAVFPNR